MAKAAAPHNVQAARQAEAERRAAQSAVAKGQTNPQEVPAGAIQFNVDQLFAAFGAKEFENNILRGQNQQLQQTVNALQERVAELEAHIEARNADVKATPDPES